ncbi:MAG: rhodanese-like domain-containing protein [Fibrobacterales bacterium]
MNHSPKFLAIVKSALKEVAEVTPNEVQSMIDTSEPMALIDCREQDEWARGHIVGAHHIGKGVIERDIESSHPNTDEKIVVYCGGGYRSVLVCATLQQMGYTNTASMSGGWREWNDNNLPTE